MNKNDNEPSVLWWLVVPFVALWSLIEQILSLIHAIRFTPARLEADAQAHTQRLYEETCARFPRNKSAFTTDLLDALLEMNMPYEEGMRCLSVAEAVWKMEGYDIPRLLPSLIQ